jgi:hypothetical protein
MAIDILGESRLTPAAAARELDVNVSTVWRWILRGIKGHRLESALIGGKRFTSFEALSRFVAQINASPGELPVVRTFKQRDRAVAKAMRELEVAGL